MPVYSYTNKKGKVSYFYKVCIKKKQFIKRGFSSKKEAKDAEAIFVAEALQETRKKTSRSVKPPLWSTLLKSFISWQKSQIKITYYYSLQREINNHIFPLLPDERVDTFTYRTFEKARGSIYKEKVCIKTKNKRLRLLQRIFDYCSIYYEYTCMDVKKLMPFKDYSIKKIELKTYTISFDDFTKIYVLADNYYKLMLLTLYLFGLRLGELMGLKVDAFDFDRKILYIFRAVTWKTGTGSFMVASPKTSTSNRFLWMTDSYIALLKKHIEDNKLDQKSFIFFSTNYSKSNYKHRPISENAIRFQFKQLSQKTNIELRPHMFRHTNVSELREKGLSLEEIQKLEGHSSSKITEEVYLHETKERRDRTQKILDDLIQNLSKKIE